MTDLVVRPTKGSQRFRQNASMAVDNGELVITDADAVAHHFTLDKRAGGPTVLCTYKVAGARGSVWEQAIVDAGRHALVRTAPGLWAAADLRRLVEAADLLSSDAPYDEPTGDRPDCVDLRGFEGTGVFFLLAMLAAIVLVTIVVYGLKALLG